MNLTSSPEQEYDLLNSSSPLAYKSQHQKPLRKSEPLPVQILPFEDNYPDQIYPFRQVGIPGLAIVVEEDDQRIPVEMTENSPKTDKSKSEDYDLTITPFSS